MNMTIRRVSSWVFVFAPIMLVTVFLVHWGTALAARVTYRYDALDRLIQETYDNGTVINYTYDDGDNRLTREVVGTTGAITLISPNGGEHWKTGTTETIRWSSTSQAGATVKVELFKGGVLNTTLSSSISAGTNGAGLLQWPIPESQAAGSDYTVKVSSIMNPSLSDSTRGKFRIDGVPKITVTAPTAGAAWIAGASSSISWTYDGDPASTVKIELLKGTYPVVVIEEDTPSGRNGTGSCTWVVPTGQEPGVDYRVKVTTADGAVTNTGSSFSILGGITVQYPNGGNSIQAGAPVEIRWRYSGAPGPAADILLLKGGVLQSTIAAATPIGVEGYGSYPWFVLAEQAGGGDYQIQITSTSKSVYTDTSDSPFTILPSSITLNYPKGSERLSAGSTYNIRWSYAGNTDDTVKIELMQNDAVYSVLAASHPIGISGYGSYGWVIPAEQPAASDYRVRVTSISNLASTDTSSNFFTIQGGGTLTLESPNGGDRVYAGATVPISWSYQGSPGGQVRLDLMKGGAILSQIAATAPLGSSGNGSYNWPVPAAQAGGSDYTIRISSTTDSACTDMSDANFTIIPVGITITYPNGWEVLKKGDPYIIKWDYGWETGGIVKLDLIKGSVVQTVISSRSSIGAEGKGSYTWTPLSTLPVGHDYRVRVTSLSNSAYTDTSNDVFTIGPTPLTVVYPNGGEKLRAETSQTITWSYSGTPGATAKVELLKGETVQYVIEESAPMGSYGRGSCNWTIPTSQELGGDYRIRITGAAGEVYVDTSNAPFSILPTLGISYPNGGEVIEAGTGLDISWAYAGSPDSNVKIELLKGGALQTVVAESAGIGTGGRGSLRWPVPAGLPGGADYRVRIRGVTNTTYTDVSDGDFSITPTSLHVDFPNTAQSFRAGANVTIRWTYNGDPGSTVKIELRKGDTVSSVIAESYDIGSYHQGSFSWPIPGNQEGGSDYKVRVTSTINGTFTDVSDDYFTILPSAITVGSPNGGNTVQAGGNALIQWYSVGAPGSTVKVDLLKGGEVDSVIAAECPNSGSYNWPVPPNQPGGEDYRVRVASTTNASCTDASDGYFKINPSSIKLTKPYGGQSFNAGMEYAISWQYSGNPGETIRIDLFLADAFQYTITPATPMGSNNNGTYQWTIPVKLAGGDEYNIRIVSSGNKASSTGELFKIIPTSLILSSPGGGATWTLGSTQSICWSFTGRPGATVRIELRKGGVFNTVIATSAPMVTGGYTDRGCQSWTVPSAQAAGTDYRVYVSSTDNPAYSDMSSGNFTIKGP